MGKDSVTRNKAPVVLIGAKMKYESKLKSTLSPIIQKSFKA